MARVSRRRLLPLGLVLSVAVAAGVLAYNDVPSAIAPADARAAAALMGPQHPFARPQGFEAEVALVLAVQDAVLGAAPVDQGLPLGQPRELSDLVRAGHGLCYDRSRAIETVLRLYGMQTRHAAVYATAATGSALRSLATPQVASHAVTEVRTEKGWLLVDSNARWIGLAADGRPFDLALVRDNPGTVWDGRVPDRMDRIFTAGYTWIYGLFSRHGRFYPPYTPVPDIEWSEMGYNLTR